MADEKMLAGISAVSVVLGALSLYEVPFLAIDKAVAARPFAFVAAGIGIVYFSMAAFAARMLQNRLKEAKRS